jgi:hypothetical protein
MTIARALDQATELFKELVEDGHDGVILCFDSDLYLQFTTDALGTEQRRKDEKMVHDIMTPLKSTIISMSHGRHSMRVNFKMEGW